MLHLVPHIVISSFFSFWVQPHVFSLFNIPLVVAIVVIFYFIILYIFLPLRQLSNPTKGAMAEYVIDLVAISAAP